MNIICFGQYLYTRTWSSCRTIQHDHISIIVPRSHPPDVGKDFLFPSLKKMAQNGKIFGTNDEVTFQAKGIRACYARRTMRQEIHYINLWHTHKNIRVAEELLRFGWFTSIKVEVMLEVSPFVCIYLSTPVCCLLHEKVWFWFSTPPWWPISACACLALIW